MDSIDLKSNIILCTDANEHVLLSHLPAKKKKNKKQKFVHVAISSGRCRMVATLDMDGTVEVWDMAPTSSAEFIKDEKGLHNHAESHPGFHTVVPTMSVRLGQADLVRSYWSSQRDADTDNDDDAMEMPDAIKPISMIPTCLSFHPVRGATKC